MKHGQPQRILVYRLSALGDVAMTIPAIYSCARQWPSCVFVVVTTPFCAQLFVRPPQNVELHPVEPPVTTWRVLRQMATMRVDAVADLHNVLRSWWVDALFLARGKRVRMLQKRRGDRKTVLGSEKAQAQPFTSRYFDVFARLGLPCQPQFTSLFDTLPPLPDGLFTPTTASSAAPPAAKGDERWIGVAPFARYPNKIYPLEQTEQVVALLANRPSTRLFLFGSKGREADILRQWERLSPRIHTVAGRLSSLHEELALMAHLDVMLTMDSANQHLASLVGTRVVSVWGSTTPACGFLAWGQDSADALCRHLSCQPCTIGGSPQCTLDTLECLTSLPPSAIVKRMEPSDKS